MSAMPKDYKVGFKRPPVATRFKPGHIGKSKGRPKKKQTVGQIIEGALMTKVTVVENGRSKTMTAQEVIIRKLALDAASGDKRAIQTLFSLRDRYQDSNETTLDSTDLESDDRKILDDYFATLQQNGAGEGSSSIASGSNPSADETNPINDSTRNADDTEDGAS
jgi:Family of unknown function (DUF5681)